jgi:hypothetical protein
MSISVVGSTQNGISNDTQSITINKPSGVVAGDLLIVYIQDLVGSTSEPNISYGSFLKLSSDYDLDQNAYLVLYKIATASEPSSYTFAANGVGFQYNVSMIAIRWTFINPLYTKLSLVLTPCKED